MYLLQGGQKLDRTKTRTVRNYVRNLNPINSSKRRQWSNKMDLRAPKNSFKIYLFFEIMKKSEKKEFLKIKQNIKQSWHVCNVKTGNVYSFTFQMNSTSLLLLLLLVCCVSLTQSEKSKKNKINAVPLKNPPGKNKINAVPLKNPPGKNKIQTVPLKTPPGKNKINAVLLKNPPGKNKVHPVPLKNTLGKNKINAVPLKTPPGKNKIQTVPLKTPPDQMQIILSFLRGRSTQYLFTKKTF